MIISHFLKIALIVDAILQVLHISYQMFQMKNNKSELIKFSEACTGFKKCSRVKLLSILGSDKNKKSGLSFNPQISLTYSFMNPPSIDDEKQGTGLMVRAALYYNPIPLDG